MYNPTVDQLFAPEVNCLQSAATLDLMHDLSGTVQVGPANPFKTRQQLATKNMLSGYVEPAHFDHFQFENQRRTFHTYGRQRYKSVSIVSVFALLYSCRLCGGPYCRQYRTSQSRVSKP